MPDVMSLYVDDSGTRHPDRSLSDQLPQHGYDWFGLGGVLIRDSDKPAVQKAYTEFCTDWGITTPLHSTDIRGHHGAFRWIGRLSASDKTRLWNDIGQLVTHPALTVLGCVVDRPGYNARYREAYGRKRWSLCKTAFNIVVERAAKFARADGARLRVYVERSDKKTDTRLQGYYDALRDTGQPFDEDRSGKYGPLSPTDFSETLYEFATKRKSSALMQIADVVLYPICIGGYEPTHRSYRALLEAGSLIDTKLSDEAKLGGGIKYSCWELEEARQKSQSLDQVQAPGQPPSG